ncbi:LIC_13029 family protein [Leptospira alstonii]|uniref:Uncharacterized protein n=2 Tax=Leptospira alstonii TaxID=28452 RepID=M6D561_9LEPT|nr:hypothetical protein [Leptospira alstonii]EMJ96358.1 hypothetical protein LEP1GSC194_3298 [Leptospira alstonii serovar Sichuan str. 79601]EQA81647.1 hypothetical protein LEP1GSC193_2866 [Leptospira alstonii serovar Pingchang str. 80-412]
MPETQSQNFPQSTNLDESDLKILKSKKTSRELSVLLYRVLFRTDEVREGAVKVLKEMFLRTHSNHPELFPVLDRTKFTKDMIDIYKAASSLSPEKLELFFNAVHVSFQNEIRYLVGKSALFSFDIIFIVIETILNEMNLSENERTMNMRDRETILKNFRAYNDLSKTFNKIGNTKMVIDKKDEIIAEISILHKDITIISIESMFRHILAQLLLSKKYNCGSLIEKWAEEYGMEDNAPSMKRLIPEAAPLTEFRLQFMNAVKSLKDENEMDLMFLRTLANYYSSWVTQVSEQIPT